MRQTTNATATELQDDIDLQDGEVRPPWSARSGVSQKPDVLQFGPAPG